MTQFSAVQQLIFPSHLDALRCIIISRRTFCHSLTYWCFLKPPHLSFLFLYSISGSIWSNTITLPIHLQKSPLSLIHSLTNGLSNCEICQIILEILRQPLTFTKYFLICILVLIFRLFHGPAVDFIWRMQWWCANKIDEHIKFVEVEKILDTVESAEVAQVLENARINGFEQFFWLYCNDIVLPRDLNFTLSEKNAEIDERYFQKILTKGCQGLVSPKPRVTACQPRAVVLCKVDIGTKESRSLREQS